MHHLDCNNLWYSSTALLAHAQTSTLSSFGQSYPRLSQLFVDRLIIDTKFILREAILYSSLNQVVRVLTLKTTFHGLGAYIVRI